MVVGLKTELGQFLHGTCCTAEQLFWLRSCSAEGWALLRPCCHRACMERQFLSGVMVVLRDDPDGRAHRDPLSLAPLLQAKGCCPGCAARGRGWSPACSQPSLGLLVLPTCVRFLISQCPPPLPEGPGCPVMWDSHTCCLLFCPFFLSSYKDLGRRVGEGEALQVFEAT